MGVRILREGIGEWDGTTGEQDGKKGTHKSDDGEEEGGVWIKKISCWRDG